LEKTPDPKITSGTGERDHRLGGACVAESGTGEAVVRRRVGG
jgi:hypothetical protein